MRPRTGVFIVLAIATAALLLSIHHVGWNRTWRPWNIPARTPAFSDLRVITGAANSIDAGYDPREYNPGAPYGSRFNQTQVWLWLRPLGIREADSTAIGLVLLVGYAIGIWWICAGIDAPSAILMVPLILSPAALLAVERGTTDLVIFVLLALAVHLADRSMVSAVAIVLVAFVLKLFPLVGLLLLLREPRGRAVRLGLVALSLAALFCAVNFRELIDIGYKTEKGPFLSYGWAVLSLHLGTLGGGAAALSQPMRWAGGVLAVGALIALPVRGFLAANANGAETPNPETPAERRSLDFFRVGAGVYVGSFMLVASWDYRLIFCLFMVAQLTSWARGERPPLARAMLIAVAVAMWSPVIGDLLGQSMAGTVIARGLEELAKWSLFFGTLYLLGRSAPIGWVRKPSARPLPSSI